MKANLGSEWHQKLIELADLSIKLEEAITRRDMDNAYILRGLFEHTLPRLLTEWKENNLTDDFGEIFKELLAERRTERDARETLKKEQEAELLGQEKKLLEPYKRVSPTALADKMKAFRRGEMPIYEPDLAGLAAANTPAGRLPFTTERMPAIEGADAVFIAVDTPRARRGGNSGIMKQTQVDLPRQPNVRIILFHL